MLAALILSGCTPSSPRPAVEDTLTSGRIRVVCAPETRALIGREVENFIALYPDAKIEVAEGTSREGIAALFAARCDLAVVTRDLVPEERGAAVRGRLEVEGYPYARDALLFVVNPDNVVENAALDDIRRIYFGGIRDWRDMGGTGGAIVPVVQPVGSDVTEFFEESVLAGESVRVPAATEPSDSAVVARVSRDRNAIGYVTLSRAARGTRALQLAPLSGLAYWRPDAETVHRGTYPLTRFHYLYARTSGPALAKGLVTFVTSYEGQKIVREAGLVPTTVPVRIVRRSPMLGTHTSGDSN